MPLPKRPAPLPVKPEPSVRDLILNAIGFNNEYRDRLEHWSRLKNKRLGQLDDYVTTLEVKAREMEANRQETERYGRAVDNLKSEINIIFAEVRKSPGGPIDLATAINNLNPEDRLLINRLEEPRLSNEVLSRAINGNEPEELEDEIIDLTEELDGQNSPRR